MKKALSLTLALLMCAALFAACSPDNGGITTTLPAAGALSGGGATTTGDGPAPADNGFSGDVTITVMLMPQAPLDSYMMLRVADAVNARIAELGYKFKVQFTPSGGGWGFDRLVTAVQTGSANLDIIPAHSWSGVNYADGAREGQYIRLDHPENNLLEKYGPDIYGKTEPAVKTAATVAGDQGFGIYGYIIEKDSVSQVGYLVNKTELEALGFTMADFNAKDPSSWEPLLKAYKEKYPGGYPFNVEPEVFDRTANYISFIAPTAGPLGVIFNDSDPEASGAVISSRYENPAYRSFLNTVRGFYQAGYIDPDQGLPGEISANSVSTRRTSGDYLITTFVYTPGQEMLHSQSASSAQGRDIEIMWAPGWSSPLATAETAMGSGLAVYAGSKYIPEAVTFLNLLAGDPVIVNLVGEGIEGESYTLDNGVLTRLDGRGGWNIWRYGVVSANSPAYPLDILSVYELGDEFVELKNFNKIARSIPSSAFVFNSGPVADQYNACIATIDRYAIPLGSGAADPSQYDTFLAELKASGVDDVVAEANRQLQEFLGS